MTGALYFARAGAEILKHKTKDALSQMYVDMQLIIIIINPLTARVVGAPQMILQPVFSIFPFLHCPLGLGELQACPSPEVVFPPLFQSALSSSPFTARWFWPDLNGRHVQTTSVATFLLDLGTDFLVGNMVFV